MKLSRRIVVAALSGLALLAGLSLGRAEEVTKEAEQELLLQQEQIQRETTVFNSLSNISKAEHECRMSAIRNFKDG